MVERTPQRIGLLYHQKSPTSQQLAFELSQLIEELGAIPLVASMESEGLLCENIAQLDLLITLGGDGTVLRAARMAIPHGLPILGINLGLLGFLTEMEPDEAREKLPLLFEGKYWLEERMALRVELHREGERIGPYEALNDAVIRRGPSAQAIRLILHVNDELLVTYVSDGIILATPTGSTGYSLAAGGIILSPELRNILVTPISPHLTPLKGMVLPGEAQVKIQVLTEDRAALSTDGRMEGELKDKDTLTVAASPHTCHFVRMHPKGYFYKNLAHRLAEGMKRHPLR